MQPSDFFHCFVCHKMHGVDNLCAGTRSLCSESCKMSDGTPVLKQPDNKCYCNCHQSGFLFCAVCYKMHESVIKEKCNCQFEEGHSFAWPPYCDVHMNKSDGRCTCPNPPEEIEEQSEYTYETIREEFEKLFPKGISKERGAALVLLAYFKMGMDKD